MNINHIMDLKRTSWNLNIVCDLSRTTKLCLKQIFSKYLISFHCWNNYDNSQLRLQIIFLDLISTDLNLNFNYRCMETRGSLGVLFNEESLNLLQDDPNKYMTGFDKYLKKKKDKYTNIFPSKFEFILIFFHLFSKLQNN